MAAPCLSVDGPAEALRQPGDRVPDADQDQHLVGDQPPQGEQQGREGGPVGPVRVVDDHHDHSLVACLVFAVEQPQQPRADGDRVVERAGAGPVTAAGSSPPARASCSTTP